MLHVMQVLSGQYAAIRRTRGDGNCFFRSFMFSYLVSLILLINLSSLIIVLFVHHRASAVTDLATQIRNIF